MSEPKKKDQETLAQALKRIEKAFGLGTIMHGKSIVSNVSAISTHIPSLDLAIGINGLPKGRIIEMFGVESCGKTTLALSIAAAFQKQGATVAFIDAEHAMDPVWAARLGVDMPKLLFSQPDSGDQAMEVIHSLVCTGEVQLIIVDSVAGLVPQKELDGELTDTVIGAQAQLMSKSLRKLKNPVNTSGCILLFINQLREKIGVTLGSNETTPGGRALKFYASIRLDIRKNEPLTKSNKKIGHKVRIRVVKNKVARPFQEVKIDLYYGDPIYGIDKIESLTSAAIDLKVLERRGSNYYYDSKKIGVGADDARNTLIKDAELQEKIRKSVGDAIKERATSLVNRTDEELSETDEDTDGFDQEEAEPEGE